MDDPAPADGVPVIPILDDSLPLDGRRPAFG